MDNPQPGNLLPTNEDRAARAAAALEQYAEPLVRDLLADIMHYCQKSGISFDAELESASLHFDAEYRGDA